MAEAEYWDAHISVDTIKAANQGIPSLYAYLMKNGMPLELTKCKLLPTQSEEVVYHLDGCTAFYTIFNEPKKETEMLRLIGPQENIDKALEKIKKFIPQAAVPSYKMENGLKSNSTLTNIKPAIYYDLENKLRT